jgi:hypothetical protein
VLIDNDLMKVDKAIREYYYLDEIEYDELKWVNYG